MKNGYIITGASSGIGQALAVRITTEGHYVLGIGRNTSKLSKTKELCASGRFTALTLDVAQSNLNLDPVFEWINSSKIQLRGLVNNAGIFEPGLFADSSDESWNLQFNNNLMSAVRLTRALYGQLKEVKGSSVVNVSSTLGRRPIKGTSAYSAIKAAMNNWTQCLALEWAHEGIRVNCICPGLVDTPIHGFYGQSDDVIARTQAHAAQPLQRMGKPEEIAEAIWFLLSEKSSWTTGSIVSVDGGISL